MVSTSYKASAPGSLMLMGEYAVLHGQLAIVGAVDKRIQVTVTPNHSNTLEIVSNLGKLKLELNKIKIIPPFQFVIATVLKFKLKQGCNITIESTFSDKVGLGSSAAVTTALIACFNQWLKLGYDLAAIAKTAAAIIRSVQGHGSGADAAASVFGGILNYKMKPFVVEKFHLDTFPEIALFYSGYKTTTSDAIQQVKQAYLLQKKLYQSILKSIGNCADEAAIAISKMDWVMFGKLMNTQQGLMQALGVSDDVLEKLIGLLRGRQVFKGVKISGSGMGDCVLGLGASLPNLDLTPIHAQAKPIAIAFSNQGLAYE